MPFWYDVGTFMRRLVTHHAQLLWIIGLSLLLYVCAYFPVFRNYQRVSTDRFYFGSEEFPIDQIGNMAYVRQGYLGDTFATFNYSIFLGRHPSIVKFEYIIIGHIARFLHIDPIIGFRLSQLTLSVCYLFVVYLLIRSNIRSEYARIMAYAFVLFGTGIVFPWEIFTFTEGAIYDVGVFVRMMLAQPHYLLGGICGLLSVFMLSRALDAHGKHIWYMGALILGICTAFFYAPTMVCIVSGFPLYLIFRIVSRYHVTKRIHIPWQEVGMLGMYAIIIAVPIVYVRYIVSTYWQDLNTAKMELLNPFTLSVTQYLAVLGVPYILAVLSIPTVIRSGSPLLLFFASWVIMHPVGEFLLSKYMHLNMIRYLITPYFVVFGILSGSLVERIEEYIKRTSQTHISIKHLTVLLILFVFAVSSITYIKSFKRATNCFCQRDMLDFGYPKKTNIEAIEWLAKNTKATDVVLSGYHAGMLIPAFSGNRVYTSWWYFLIGPPEFSTVVDSLAAFYRQGVPPDEAYAFLKKTGISYVFYSQEEHGLNPVVWGLDYPFLKEVYNRADVTIYKVQ